MSPEAKHFYAFGPFRLDSEKRVLVRDGTPVPLTPKAAETLLLLVKNAGYLVHKDELMAQVWPEAFVEEGNLNKNIFVLRRVLGERDGQQEYIETVPKRGYRFVAPVEEVTHAEAPQQSKGPSAPSLIGQKVSHYRVLDVIGGGGMGMVYRAEDLKLGREVALKFLPPELASDSVALQRFEREARAASSLDHSNICTVYEVEEHDGQPFIVMQLLQGETLRDRLSVLASKQEKMMIDELLRIAIQTCDGLEVAHARGIVHRDIKPANIFLTAAGQVKILDFGLAKVVQVPGLSPMKGGEIEDPDFRSANGDERKIGVQTARPGDAALTQFGVAMGTAGYMSPEQVRGEVLDARTDIFSFGLVLYEMATGRRAFTGETAAVVREAIVNRTPIPIHDLNSTFPLELEVLIDKALAKDRERRYQSAAEMLADLEQVKTKSLGRLSGRWKRYAAAALLLAVTTGGTLYWRSHQKIKITPKDSIVVAHFVNSTGDPAMDGGALDWPLSRELQESPYLTVLYPSKVFDTVKLLGVSESPAWYGPWGPKLTPELARQVCLRSDSRAYVTASITNAGNYYHITLNA